MNGSSLAQLIIPIAGTLSLTAWLALVFHAGHRPWRADGNPTPGYVNQAPAPAASQEDLPAVSVEREDFRTMAGMPR